MDNKRCIFSYNSRDFNLDKQVFCHNLFMSSGCNLTVLCHQENFLLKANGYIIKHVFIFYSNLLSKNVLMVDHAMECLLLYLTQ